MLDRAKYLIDQWMENKWDRDFSDFNANYILWDYIYDNNEELSEQFIKDNEKELEDYLNEKYLEYLNDAYQVEEITRTEYMIYSGEQDREVDNQLADRGI